MADRIGFASWLGVREGALPTASEACRDPKMTLLRLARQSRKRRIRDGLLPRPGAVSQVGLEYNDLLRAFVREHWRLEEAARNASSLTRTLRRLREFC